MSEQDDKTQGGEEAVATEPAADRIEFALAYEGASQVVARAGTSTVALFGNTYRTPVRASGRILDPLRFREVVSVFHEIVGSDFRYKPKDRSAYLAYQRLKKANASLSAWQAQQAYHEWLQRNDPDAWTALDPVATVHPDELFLEVFSKDEGTYARLGIDWSAFELDGELGHGTTNIDFGQTLFDGLQRMRSYRESRLEIGTRVGASETGSGSAALGTESAIRKRLRLPASWLRGFLQVQSAAALGRTSFRLEPIDLYNVLRFLRLNADRKRARRAMRIELVPGERPRIVLEPWEEEVFESTGPVYAGRVPQVVRIWGRRRLMMLRRLLPLLDSVEVHILGSGMPSFWVLRAGAYTLTLGLSGFTASNWSQAMSFDLLLPRSSLMTPQLTRALDELASRKFASREALAEATGLSLSEVTEVMQQASQQGKVMLDIDRNLYRIRPLTEEPLDLVRLEFRNDRERLAHDLLAEKDAVKLVSETPLPGGGVEVVGKVAVAADRREYRVSLTLGEDGRVLKADDTSDFFRKHGLKEGPSVPLIALRMAWAREEARRQADRGRARAHITVETRTYVRRRGNEEDVFQLALDRKRLKIRRGIRGRAMRLQQLVFNDVAGARSAYFERVDALESAGWLDASDAA